MRKAIHLIMTAVLMVAAAGCTVKEETRRLPQPDDTLYTEEAALLVYAREPEKALDCQAIQYGMTSQSVWHE